MNHKIMTKIISTILLGTIIVYTTSPVFALTKDETVYSKINAKGTPYHTIVNSHITNSDKDEFIHDVSDLLKIINTNGEESFTQNGNSIIWASHGNDIYYQGETQKELPITCSIKYELDGKEMSPQDIVGKTGKVKITLAYTNKDSHTVIINGKKETLYTPFVVMCGTVLNNDKNKNITISHGKLVDDGSKTIALGITTPGLQESLNLPKSTLELPSSMEITMDSTDFELGSMITYITPKILDDEDLSILDKVDDIFSQVNTLQSSSHQLVEGSHTLKEGSNTYLEKMGEFNGAVKQIADGINYTNSNYSKINDGIHSLNQKAPALSHGSQTISDGTTALSNALNNLNSSLNAMPENSQDLINQVSQLSTEISSLTPMLRNLGTNNATKINEINTLITENQNRKTSLTNLTTKLSTEKDTALAAGQTQLADILQEQINENTSLLAILEKNIQELSYEKVMLTTLSQNNLSTLANGLDTINHSLTKLSALISNVYSLKPVIGELAQNSSLLANGAKELSGGVNQMIGGISTLADGSSQMKSGLTTLEKGANQLLGASIALLDGAKTISSGATTLAEGMTRFNDEGIDKIGNYIHGNLKDVKFRIEKLQNLSEEYNNFSKINENHNGTVKFILITDSLKKDDSSKKNNHDKEEE